MFHFTAGCLSFATLTCTRLCALFSPWSLQITSHTVNIVCFIALNSAVNITTLLLLHGLADYAIAVSEQIYHGTIFCTLIRRSVMCCWSCVKSVPCKNFCWCINKVFGTFVFSLLHYFWFMTVWISVGWWYVRLLISGTNQFSFYLLHVEYICISV